MNNQEDFLEFIKRAQDLYKDIDNKAHYNGLLKKYFNTSKGIFAKRLGDYKRRSRIKKYEVSWEERSLIGRFYKNCPQGYEVDHIIPVSKGGKHCLSNLQYLTKEENRRKYNKLDFKK